MIKYQCGLFPLSADPFHTEHKEVVGRALAFCRKIVVMVSDNGSKRHVFTLDERLAMATRALKPLVEQDRVAVIGSRGLMCDEYAKCAADVLIRGIRGEKDRVYEEEYLANQRFLFPWFAGESVEYVVARPDRVLVSSSFVKGSVQAFLEVDGFVDFSTKQLLEERILGQYKLGVTGTMGSGKTSVIAAMVSRLCQQEVSAHVVAIDELVRALYREKSPGAEKIRQTLRTLFGSQVLTPDGGDVERPMLAERIFSKSCSQETRRMLHALTHPHIDRLYRDELRRIRSLDLKPQLVFLEWAQRVETGLNRRSNLNTIVVDAPEAERNEALQRRGISPERQSETRRVQGTPEGIVAALERDIVRYGHGITLRFMNRWLSESASTSTDLAALVLSITKLFPAIVPEKGSSL